MGRRVVEMSDIILPLFFGEGVHHYRVEVGLPKDVRIVNAVFEFPQRAGHEVVKFLLESDEWEEPAEGQPYPRFDPLQKTIHKTDPGWDGP
jgi:sirohydrochlorin ferrochelatase